MWGNKYKSCVNCGTLEHPHRSNGFCSRCYGPAMQVREVERWSRSNPSTLRRYPNSRPERASDEEFELFQEGYLHELRIRLERLKHWEDCHDADVDGISIEFQLDRIARYAGACQKSLFHGYANRIDWNFTPKQKRMLRNLLVKIEANRPWRGVDLGRVFQYRDQHRKRQAES